VEQTLITISMVLVASPLLASLIAGLLGKQIDRVGAHSVTILGVFIAFVLSVVIFWNIVIQHVPTVDATIYTWAQVGDVQFNVGFLIDQLSATMLLIVTFVSLLVHIYSVGYMVDDPGYQRFFSYISLFTFAMLMLVLANNFMQLFFGWEGVGLASYLLIGFWFKKDAATIGSFKAFIVNRVGDFGFLLGIAIILSVYGSVSYASIFSHAGMLTGKTITLIPGHEWSLASLLGILLFVGAMGKSAQIPLHVWLPESMEGPTPISALIHAATMVTAGIFMVSRMSPIYELAPTALNFILIVGATGALFLGLVGLVQNDIKRVVAYSTLSQLGYMVAGLGASAYAVSMFHLATHACFKALLFLGAGSVIIAMHHDQDLRNMGNLRKFMPITYVTFLIGSLALSGIPPFAGFYSKDMLIEAVRYSHLPGTPYATICLTAGVFVTALYTFRAFFLAFHTKPRMSDDLRLHLHEPSVVVWGPLVVLAIPSVLLGAVMINAALFAKPGLFGHSIYVAANHNVLQGMALEYRGWFDMILHSFMGLPVWLAIAGIATAWLCYEKFPELPGKAVKFAPVIHKILINKYGFDKFNQFVIVGGVNCLGQFFYKVMDLKIIDGLVNGVAVSVGSASGIIRKVQTGYLYHYICAMLLGVLGFLGWLLWT